MYAVYVRVRAWGAWGEADRWFLLSRFERRADAERVAAQHAAGAQDRSLVVDEAPRVELPPAAYAF